MSRRPTEKELYKTLKENELDFIPRGIYHLKEIYDFIKNEYPRETCIFFENSNLIVYTVKWRFKNFVETKSFSRSLILNRKQRRREPKPP